MGSILGSGRSRRKSSSGIRRETCKWCHRRRDLGVEVLEDIVEERCTTVGFWRWGQVDIWPDNGLKFSCRHSWDILEWEQCQSSRDWATVRNHSLKSLLSKGCEYRGCV